MTRIDENEGCRVSTCNRCGAPVVWLLFGQRSTRVDASPTDRGDVLITGARPRGGYTRGSLGSSRPQRRLR